MGASDEIRDLVKRTPFVDTHEHLWEERTRLAGLRDPLSQEFPTDVGILFWQYSDGDLVSAGLSPTDRNRALDPITPIDEKWRIIGPAYARSRHTGYMQCIRESVRLLYGEEDVTDSNYAHISKQVIDRIEPGFYKHILRDIANVEYSQVNTLEHLLFCETQYPNLLAQDLSFVPLSTQLNIASIAETAGRNVGSLADWHSVIDWVFDTYGPRAIAVKNQSAYFRRLDYDQVTTDDARPLFAKYLKDQLSLTEPEHKAIQDHLFHYCVRKATEYKLPIKLHTGYYTGWNTMPLHRVRKNASDLCPILLAHPDAKFVLMHITYPYQDEAIALAKHYPNAYVDLCWAWIINPAAGVRFVKEFLMAAPHVKLFTFGGDYLPVEMVPGHAVIARKGLTQAISELIEEGWLAANEAPRLIDRLMRGNAHEIFDYEGRLKA